MATSQKLTEHFLTCPVCFEVFTNPSTLSCDHTFCGQCMVSYTKTRPDAISARSLLCPFCERLTKVPDPQRPVEEWPSQMKPGLLLRGLLESFGPGSKDTTNCNPCHDEGEVTPASVWCSACDVSLCKACLKAHRRFPATQQHIVSDLSDDVVAIRRPKVMCQEHKDEVIKFYCKDCRKTLCQSCCIIYHMKCESVVALESMLPEIRATLEARKIALEKKMNSEEKLLVSCKSQYSEIQQSKSSIQSQIRSTAQKAMDAIKKKEKKLMDELDEVTDKQMGQLKADIKTGDMAIQIYRQQSEFIDQALNSDNESNMYDMYQSRESGAVESVGDIGGKERGKKSKMELSLDLEKMKKALDELSVGEIKMTVCHRDIIVMRSKPKLHDTISCKTENEKREPDLKDIAFLSVGGTDVLVVTDSNNKCIKSFYNRNNNQAYSTLKLPSSPFRIAKLDDNKIAVSLPGSNHIVTVAVFPELSILSSVTTSKPYWGLTALTSTTLAAGSQSHTCVDILDRSGKVLKSLIPIYNGQKIIKYSNFLCTTRDGNILVSDEGTKSVLCLTTTGDIVFNYCPTGVRELKSPKGILSTDTGDILVVDSTGYKVIQLNMSGKFVRDILTARDGLSHPWYLDYVDGGNIYVTHNYNCVQVFTFCHH